MLEIQYFDHLMQTAISLEKTLMMGKTEGRRRREVQRMWWFEDITHSVDMGLSKLWETVKDREDWSAAARGLQRVGHDLMTTTTATNLEWHASFFILFSSVSEG